MNGKRGEPHRFIFCDAVCSTRFSAAVLPRCRAFGEGGKLHSCVNFIRALEFGAMRTTLTTKEAAQRLGVTPARVRQLVLSGELPAEKFGRDLMIKESDLKLVKERPVGRPPKLKATGAAAGAKRRRRKAA